MTCRRFGLKIGGLMGTRFFLVVLLFAGLADAAPLREFHRRFASARVEIPAPSVTDESIASMSDPTVLRWFFQDLLGREPDTAPKSFSGGCSPDDLEDGVRRTRVAPRQAQAIEGHLRRCAAEVETGAGRLRNSAGVFRLRYDRKDHPQLESVLFKLPGGVSLRGLLALKGDRKPRPFVVLRIGIFSNVEKYFVEQFLLMQLFEQGPANVLVLESTTGSGYIAANEGFGFANGLETLQNLQVAKILRDKNEPLNALVGSLHFVGISFGGHGLFGAAAFDPKQPGGPRIDSFTAYCPLIHPRATFADALEPGYGHVVADFWATVRMKALRKRDPSFAERPWSEWLFGRPSFLKRVLDLSEKGTAARRGLAEGLAIPEEWLADPRPEEPWPWFTGLKAPFLILATKNDSVVNPALNVRAFEKEMLARAKKENVGVVLLDRGYHCTLPMAYDWNTMAAALNGAIRASDSSWRPVETTLDMDLGDVVGVDAIERHPQISYRVEWPERGPFAAIRVSIGDDAAPASFSMNLPLGSFDAQVKDGDLNEPAKKMIERWLHRSLRLDLVKKDGRAFLRVSWPESP